MERLLFLLASLAAYWPAAQAQSSTQTDQMRLLTQRYDISNWDAYAAANNITGWVGDNSVPVCLWTGVTCTPDGKIQQLAMQCPSCPLKAQGVLSSNLSSIQSLNTVNMQQQRLGGPLPPEYGGNGSFPSLINLIIQQNFLTGSVPASWAAPGSFPNLALIAMQVNNLTGPLPEPELWPQLNVIRMQQNLFNGTLPASWATSLPNLQIMALQQNRLRGQLPAVWAPAGSFTRLEEIYLQGNLLEGSLPHGNAQVTLRFPVLRIFDLSHNRFTGSLPPEWGAKGTSPNLQIMYLRNLSLDGTLPAEWGSGGNFERLRQLWLDSNDLSGTVPASWADLPALEQVYVRPGNARLCGPLPPGITFKLCNANGNTECNETAALDGPTCPPWVPPLPDDGGGSDTAAIVGGVVGGVVGGALLLAAVLLAVRWRRRRRQRESPFIAEANAAVAPGKGDLSKYAQVLESVEGGGPPEPGAKPPGWPARTASRVSSMLRGSSQRSASQPGASPIGSAALSAAALSAATPAASVAGGSVRGGSLAAGARPASRDTLMLFSNDSVLLSHDMSATAVALQGPPPSAFAFNYTGQLTNAAVSGAMTPVRQSTDVRAEAEALLWQQIPDWEIRPEEIEYMKRADGSDWELGCGGFGKVYKAMRNGAQPVAVKVLTAGSETRYMALEEFRREVAILKACRDPNIVAFLGACLRDDCSMLVTEYCEGGNLARNILARKVTWYRRGRKIAIDIAKGLVFLHSRRIVHLDLKSPNILLARDGTAKIADVGLAKIIAQEYSAVTGAVGTLAWSSPEMLLGARCTEKSDIYSYGVVLWEIATGQTPIRGQLRDVRVPDECPDELRRLMLDCLEQSPKRRPSAVQLIERLKRIPVSPLEHQAALPPPSLRPDTPAEARAAAGRRARGTGGAGAVSANATPLSAFGSGVSAFAAAAGAGTPTSPVGEAGRAGGAALRGDGSATPPAPGSAGSSLPTPFGGAKPSSGPEGLAAWGSEDDLASSMVRSSHTETEGGSASLNLSRDPSLLAPGQSASLARAGSGLPPKASPFASKPAQPPRSES